MPIHFSSTVRILSSSKKQAFVALLSYSSRSSHVTAVSRISRYPAPGISQCKAFSFRAGLQHFGAYRNFASHTSYCMVINICISLALIVIDVRNVIRTHYCKSKTFLELSDTRQSTNLKNNHINVLGYSTII